MSKRFISAVVRRLTAVIARCQAQRDLDHVLAHLASVLAGRLRPEVSRQDLLRVLNRLEPIVIYEDGSVGFSSDPETAAQDLGLLVD